MSPRATFVAAWPLLALIGLAAIAAVIGSLGGAPLDRTVTSALINLILVIGLYTFIGLSGVFSFGHVSFMALGAYTAGIVTLSPEDKQFSLPDLPSFLADTHFGPVAAALCGGLVAAVFAAALSLPLMRLSGLTAGLATVALLIVVRVILQNWERFTSGTAGLAGIPTETTRLSAFLWVVLALCGAFAYQRSRWGTRLRASREDEIAARSIGVRVSLERSVAFVFSAFIMGVGGALFAQNLGNATPDQFYVSITFLLIAMLVIGGVTSLAGAVIGSLAISALQELLRRTEDGVNVGPIDWSGRAGLTEVGLAVAMLLVLVLRPRGITGGRELSWPFGGSGSQTALVHDPQPLAPPTPAAGSGPTVIDQEGARR